MPPTRRPRKKYRLTFTAAHTGASFVRWHLRQVAYRRRRESVLSSDCTL